MRYGSHHYGRYINISTSKLNIVEDPKQKPKARFLPVLHFISITQLAFMKFYTDYCSAHSCRSYLSQEGLFFLYLISIQMSPTNYIMLVWMKLGNIK
jgi:hypothetical protein